jgi:large subunit ribosomal protein L9
MKVKVILLEAINSLGKTGDVVAVKKGFFRNYLFPRNKAVFLDKTNLAKMKDLIVAQEKKEFEAREVAVDLKNQLSGLIIKSLAQATDDGKIFGSILLGDIKDKINEQILNLGFDYKIETGSVFLDKGVDKVKNLGEYNVKIRFFEDIECVVRLFVERA